MGEAARDESPDRVDDLLDGRLAALRPEADRLRAALLRLQVRLNAGDYRVVMAPGGSGRVWVGAIDWRQGAANAG